MSEEDADGDTDTEALSICEIKSRKNTAFSNARSVAIWR